MFNLTKSRSLSVPAGCTWRRRRGERDREIPKFCWCREKSVIKTLETAKNPGGLFYSCPNGSEGILIITNLSNWFIFLNDKFYLFTWTNECVVEEMEDLQSSVSELKRDMLNLRSEIVVLVKKIEQCKVMVGKNMNGCYAIL
ncbi:hypothetical protein N665_0383s0022 [Sinapis alba]|nr:hypothetical protein N665_0383s0022 [Sinapis alba]